MTRGKFLLVACCVLLLGVFIARGPILSAAFRWYMHGYCRSCLAAKLDYETIDYADGKWVLKHPSLNTKKSISDGGYHLKAESAQINFDLALFSRTINLHVALEDPIFEVGRQSDEMAKIIATKSNEDYKFFHVHSSVKIPQGSVVLYAQAEKPSPPLFFSIDLSCKPLNQGCISLWCGEGMQGLRGCKADLSITPEHYLKLDVDIHHAEVAPIANIIYALFPSNSQYLFTEGTLNGKVSVVFPTHQEPYADGHIAMHNVECALETISLKASIPEANLVLMPLHNLQRSTTATIGHMETGKDITLQFFKEGKLFRTFKDFKAKLSYKSGEKIDFDLDGHSLVRNKTQTISVVGNARMEGLSIAGFSAGIDIKNSDLNPDVKMHFSMRKLEEAWLYADAEIEHFGPDEVAFAQNIVTQINPQWESFQMHQGALNASMLFYLENLSVSKVEIRQLTAQDTKFTFAPWELWGSAKDIQGQISVDFSHANPIDTLNANLRIADGTLRLSSLSNPKWHFTDIHTNLAIDKGVVQKSLLKGKIGGLLGQVELDGTNALNLISLDFKGKAQELAEVLPETLKTGVDKKFSHDHLHIVASAIKAPLGFSFKGRVKVNDMQKSCCNEVDFGFLLQRSPPKLWQKWPPHVVAADYYPNAGFEVLQKSMPLAAKPLLGAYSHLLKSTLGIAGFVVKEGWFKAQALPLEKFLSPFIFLQDQMQLSGRGNFVGTFDARSVALQYDASDMVLENKEFCVEVKNLGKSDEHGHEPAVHFFDIEQMKGYGSLPIRNATYFEKNSGLLFTDINTKITLEDTKLYAAHLKTFCTGIYFSGNAAVDWSRPGKGVFDVDMRIDTMAGRMSQAQHFFSHFKKPMLIFKMPIEGNLSLRDRGARLTFAFDEHDYQFDANIEGSLSDANINSQGSNVFLQEIGLNFEYKHVANFLEISDIQGCVLVGTPKHFEEYVLAGDCIKFTDFARNEMQFDLWVGDRNRDIIRLAGQTLCIGGAEQNQTMEVKLDRTLSHFGDVHPLAFHLQLKDWSQITQFHASFDFKLETLLNDLQRFSRTGLLFFSRSLLKELNQMKDAEGSFKTDLQFDGSRSLLTYNVSGHNIVLGERRFNKFLLTGNKKEEVWSIGQLQLDEMSAAFDIAKKGEKWDIQFLGARVGKSFLLGMEGEYDQSTSHLNSKINLLEVDIAQLGEWPVLKKMLEEYNLSGTIKANGLMKVDFANSFLRNMRVDLSINGSLTAGHIKEMYVQDIPNFVFQYTTDRGFSLSGIRTALKSINDDSELIGMYLEGLKCDFISRELVISELQFHLPVINLKHITEKFHHLFPDILPKQTADAIVLLKAQGNLNGTISGKISEKHYALQLGLENGSYQFLGKNYNLRDLTLSFSPLGVRVSSEYLYQSQRLFLNASVGADFRFGEVVVAQAESNYDKASNAFSLHWKRDSQTGCYIEKISGSMCGISCDLVRNTQIPLSSHALYLSGKVQLDMNKAKVLLEDETAKKINACDVGAGYWLSGQWVINSIPEKILADCITFKGEFSGREFDFYGYRLNSLFSQLEYSPDAISASNITVTDPCGTIHIKQIAMQQRGGQWNATLPVISITQFRPSLLRRAKQGPLTMGKAFVITELQINDVHGILGDRNSFTGSGNLTFANPPKNDSPYPIFAIPAEILTRIGLDLAVLNPVKGVVEYDISAGKVHLKRFKDVYSKGRVSKFYLARNGASYVDFDGNINIKIRMKQYNLIFKLAELFTVTVQGTLNKPTFTLHKQPKASDIKVVRDIK